MTLFGKKPAPSSLTSEQILSAAESPLRAWRLCHACHGSGVRMVKQRGKEVTIICDQCIRKGG